MTEPVPAGPHAWGAHDDKYCADSHADEPEGYNWGCHDGAYYGPCGHENCYGQDEYLGECSCVCHGADVEAGSADVHG